MNGGSETGLPKRVPSLFEMVHAPVFLASKTSTELKPPTPLRFPTFWELAGAQTTAPERQKNDGLFRQLIGEPLLLFQSLLDDPDRFETGVSELLQDLINKRKELAALSQEEQELLNRAAIDFATAKSPRPKAEPSRHQARELPAAARQAVEQSEVEYREGGGTGRTINVPKTAPTFWWRTKK